MSPVKRSHSNSPSPSPQPEVPDSTPETPSKSKKQLKGFEMGDIKPSISPSSKKGGPGPWTPEKKEKMAELLITRGLAAISNDDLAAELGVTKQQIRDATQKGKNNLRARIIASAKNA